MPLSISVSGSHGFWMDKSPVDILILKELLSFCLYLQVQEKTMAALLPAFKGSFKQQRTKIHKCIKLYSFYM